MESDHNSTESIHHPNSMGNLLGDHQMALASASALSFMLGLPLTLHMLWHLQVGHNYSKCTGCVITL